MLWDDPGVLTFSIHETGRALFPGSGEADEIGEGVAAGTSVNVPLLPGTGEGAWLAILESLLPELAATFGPDLIVSQHGADSHAWDPLAHLNVTTTAHGAAARLVDALAHRHASGRWLATGGGGYDAYRVVPRTWALTWLAGTHREVPDRTPEAWRDRWAGEAARYGQAPLPERFDDPPNAGIAFGAAQEAVEARSAGDAALIRQVLVPRLVREARDRSWWDPLAPRPAASAAAGRAPDAPPSRGDPTILPVVDADTWSRLALEPSVIAPAAPTEAHAIVLAALIDGARVTAAVRGTRVVGLVVSRRADVTARMDLLSVGVAPRARRGGLAGRMLAEHLADTGSGEAEVDCEVTVAERDVFDPLDRSVRGSVARRLLESAGFRVEPASEAVRSIDPGAVVGRR
jgi:ribosomal protein S18 acetylase RimI-like enzyme